MKILTKIMSWLGILLLSHEREGEKDKLFHQQEEIHLIRKYNYTKDDLDLMEWVGQQVEQQAKQLADR